MDRNEVREVENKTAIPQGEQFANVRIVSEDANAVVYLDGKKVNGLMGYEIIHDRTKSQSPIVRLNIQSKLDIETGMIPELPEPWTYCYSLNSEFLRDKGE